MQARLKAVQVQMEEVQRRMAEVTNPRQKAEVVTKPRQAASSIEVTPIAPTPTRT